MTFVARLWPDPYGRYGHTGSEPDRDASYVGVDLYKDGRLVKRFSVVARGVDLHARHELDTEDSCTWVALAKSAELVIANRTRDGDLRADTIEVVPADPAWAESLLSRGVDTPGDGLVLFTFDV
jgi:hypothetical protein